MDVELTTRFLSACVASTIATLVVTPFDVVKTRLQASSSTPSWIPVRASKDAFRQYRCLAMHSGSFVHNSALVHLSPAAAGHSGVLSLADVCPEAAAAAARENRGVAATFRRIIREEGVRALWKGLDTAMLLNIPMISVYMCLYDTLHSQLRQGMGMYAPAVAGMAARTATVLATAPLELIRTRQQASVGASSTMSSLAATWQGANSISGVGGTSRLRATLAGMPGLWTGVGATLARDVPFTIIYWCLVEPIRAHFLQTEHADATPKPSSSGSSSAESSRSASSASEAIESCERLPEGLLLHLQQQHGPPSPPTDTSEFSSAMPLPEAVLPLISTPAPASSPALVLTANLVAGSVAGGLAAALTTPFDVLKTRLQTQVRASAPGMGPSQAGSCRVESCTAGRRLQPVGGLETLVNIWRTEGMQGLFAGLVPRAARTVPACAIVLSTYEVLKVLGGS